MGFDMRNSASMTTVLTFLVFTLFSVTCEATSISATGVIDQVTTDSLRIERPDGSKLKALKGNDPYVGFEFNAAYVGKEAWGRASCVNGVCTWTCLDGVPECDSFFDVELLGTVVGKNLCAGVIYITISTDQGLVRSRCEGAKGYAACDALMLNETVKAVITVGCGDGKWKSFTSP